MTTFKQMRQERAELDGLIVLAQREHRAGRIAEATAAYRKMIAIRPDMAEARNNLGNLLLSQGKLDEAVTHYEQAIVLRPDYVDAHYNLGVALADQGKLEQAAARYEQALTLKPDYAEAHNNLGNVFREQGQLDQAVARYQQALALRPNYPEANTNLGVALKDQGKLDEAVAQCRRALALRPDLAEAHTNLGDVLLKQGKLEEAATLCQRALTLRPDLAEAHNILGIIFAQQDKPAQALAQFEQALAVRPDYSESHNNLGNLLLSQGKLDEAAARYEHAVTLRPNFADAHYNLGISRWEQGKFDGAAGSYQQALALRPDFTDARLGLAACFLVKGDYERGWPAYEDRLRRPGHLPRHKLRRWMGEPLAGCSLLLVAEQGVGDTLHFVRYARLLKERGARVVLACPTSLGRLLASHPDLDELFILGSAPQLPHCDFYLPLLSGPVAFRTDSATIPCQVPYLLADPELTDQWRQELATIDGFKIGIAWQGSREYRLDRWRSIPLAEFAPLAELPGVRLVGLQKGFGSEQVARVDFPVLDLSDRLDEAAGPFMDTAAVIQSLDLVVTPDTAIAHLAGALGIPTWLALQFAADWRWLLDRDDSPWYPTMRLFRQTTVGRWPDVFERMAKAVQASRSAGG